MGILPWLIGGAVALFLYNKSKNGSSVTASNGTSVSLPGLSVPTSVQPLTSDDVSLIRSLLDGSAPLGSRGERIDSVEGYQTSAARLVAVQELLNEWGQVGRSDRTPDFRTVLSLG